MFVGEGMIVFVEVCDVGEVELPTPVPASDMFITVIMNLQSCE